MVKKILFILSLILLPQLSYADPIKTAKDAVVKDLIYNINKGSVVNNQRGGYLTPGSAYVRIPVKNLQIANMQLPHYSGGCNGIDIFNGSFSYINSKELENLAKSIMQNSIGYAFELALESFSPNIAHAKNYLDSIQRDINSMNINSCHLANNLVAGAWPKSDAASQKICNSSAVTQGQLADWAKGQHECGSNGKRETYLDKKSPYYKHILTPDYNLVWDVLSNEIDKDYNLEILSLLGTIIHKYENGKEIKQYLPPVINDQQTINSYMVGGITQIYSCENKKDDNQCLTMKITDYDISYEASKQGQTYEILKSITNKIVGNNDEQLTDKEINFINTTSIPILRIAYLNAALKASEEPIIAISEFIEPIAEDRLFREFTEFIELLDKKISNFETVQITDEMKDFRREIFKQKQLLEERKHKSFLKLIAMMNLFTKIKALENNAFSILETLERIK